MASVAVRSKAVILLLFTLIVVAPILWRFDIRSLFCFAVLSVVSSFAIISLRKRELVALLLLCSECHVAVVVL